MFRVRRYRAAVAIAIAAAAVVGSSTPALGHTTPGPLRVVQAGEARELTGQTYGQWSADWWKRMMRIQVADNPGIDPTGANCRRGNADGMFFLAGDFTGSTSLVTRTCTVPADKPLLFPVTNVECSNVESYPFFGATNRARADCAREITDATILSSLKLTLDGTPVGNVARFRFASAPFNFTVPPTNNIIGVPGATSGRSASDGFWIMLAPPSPGHHVFHFESTIIFGTVIDFVQNITYNLNVPCDGDARAEDCG